MAWIDFAVCLFLGFLGVHKFREKKTKTGILYLFTGGLLGIGWIYDTVQYFIIAVKFGDKAGKILLWILTVFFVLLALAQLPALAGFLSLITALLLVPIRKWKDRVNRYISGKSRQIAVIILAVLSIAAVSSPENRNGNIPSKSADAVMTAEDTAASIQELIAEMETEISVETEAEQTEESVTEMNYESDTDTEFETEIVTEPTAELITEMITEDITELTAETAAEQISESVIQRVPETALAPAEEAVIESVKDEGWDYVLNTNTGKFHYSDCRSAKQIKDKNKAYFHGTREEVIGQGYSPCGNCNP